jgi:hypothetical protein
MTRVDFQLNPQAPAQVISVGEEETPVVIIDDVARNTRDIIHYAVNAASFVPDDDLGYPGLRAQLPRIYLQEIIRGVAPFLAGIYSVPRNLQLEVGAAYSLVAKPPEELQIGQRIPHVDSYRKYYFAITHYLNPGDFGGTGIFRHKPTGFEKVTEDRVDEYKESTNSFFQMHGNPSAKYIRESTDQFELVLGIDYRPNRLVAYPGNLLHSGLIDPQRDIDADPATGRLTGNFFFDGR